MAEPDWTLYHADWCCAKGCPGPGFCEKGAVHSSNCDLECNCEVAYFKRFYQQGLEDGAK